MCKQQEKEQFMNTVYPIKDQKQLDLMKMYLRNKNKRDYLMFMVGISSALRISDILKLKVQDVWTGKKPQERIVLNEKKTGKSKIFPMTLNLQKAIKEYINKYDPEPGDYLFVSRKGNKPISRQHANRILSTAADYIGIIEPTGTHSMRKTWGYWAYKSGVGLAYIMEVLNHSSVSHTMRYLGITQEELDKIYINLNL